MPIPFFNSVPVLHSAGTCTIPPVNPVAYSIISIIFIVGQKIALKGRKQKYLIFHRRKTKQSSHLGIFPWRLSIPRMGRGSCRTSVIGEILGSVLFDVDEYGNWRGKETKGRERRGQPCRIARRQRGFRPSTESRREGLAILWIRTFCLVVICFDDELCSQLQFGINGRMERLLAGVVCRGELYRMRRVYWKCPSYPPLPSPLSHE